MTLHNDTITGYKVFEQDFTCRDYDFQGEGCAISQAGVAMLTKHILGKTKNELQNITSEELLAMLGLTNLNPTRMRCALLGLKTMQKSITSPPLE
jgi:NifU-like protein involved in Fe-S cluster formation